MGTTQPIMIFRCPNCKYTDRAKYFKTFWEKTEDETSKRIKICPKCGTLFADNMRYIGEELYRVAEGFGLIGRDNYEW